MQIDHVATKIKKAGGNGKSEGKKIAHVIMNAPEAYESVTETVGTMLGMQSKERIITKEKTETTETAKVPEVDEK
jgi:hypothetical protein